MSKNIRNGSIFIIIAAILWALDGIIRRSLYSLSPLTIVFYEHLVGSIILTPFIFKKLIKENITASSFGWALLVSLLSGLLGTLWFTTALMRVNFIAFSVVYLLQKLQPIFATTSAAILLKEKINKKYFFWAATAIIAAYFVTFPGGRVSWQSDSQTIIAALFALGAAVAWGTSTSFSKMVLQSHSYEVATGMRFYITSLATFLILIIFQGSLPSLITPTEIMRFSFIALSTGMVALLIYYRGLQTTEAKVATILELVFPALAVFIDAVLFKTVLMNTQYLAAIILLLAIYFTSKYTKGSENV